MSPDVDEEAVARGCGCLSFIAVCGICWLIVLAWLAVRLF